MCNHTKGKQKHVYDLPEPNSNEELIQDKVAINTRVKLYLAGINSY